MRRAALAGFLCVFLSSLSHSTLHARPVALSLTLEEQQEWTRIGFNLDDALTWKRVGMAPAEARQWVMAGIQFAEWANQWTARASSPPTPRSGFAS